MGVGGGIVADSDPQEEYRECLLKASFLTRTRRQFRLIETLLWQRDYPLIALHLDRLQSSAAYFDFAFDRGSTAAQLRDLARSFDANTRYRVRLLLDATGSISLASEAFLDAALSCHITVAREHTSSADPFFRHKTTNREMYDRLHKAARAAGFDEVIFKNERDEVTEGAVSNHRAIGPMGDAAARLWSIARNLSPPYPGDPSGRRGTRSYPCGPAIRRRHLYVQCAARSPQGDSALVCRYRGLVTTTIRGCRQESNSKLHSLNGTIRVL
jgi:hypothetical protein